PADDDNPGRGIRHSTERGKDRGGPFPSSYWASYDFVLAPTGSLAGSFSTQCSVRCTAFFQPASPSARCCSVDFGLKTLSTCQFLRSSSKVLQNPVASPAP